MKIYKKTFTFLAISMFCVLALTSNSRLQAQTQDQDNPVESIEQENWCRCKHDGCHQGNFISFRRACNEARPCSANICD